MSLIQYLNQHMKLRNVLHTRDVVLLICMDSYRVELNIHTSIHLHTFIVYTRNECSRNSAYVRRLAWAFIAVTCDKHQKCICWLISVSLHVTLSWEGIRARVSNLGVDNVFRHSCTRVKMYYLANKIMTSEQIWTKILVQLFLQDGIKYETRVSKCVAFGSPWQMPLNQILNNYK